ncbi:hypothetical protein V7O66_00100 [Methanolobus sp. ZRKC3]|uniref:hypothetical protein n=1 Tax=Methanolobus sp. ZRKC3 TaxID=3125786 RepID=UPI00324DAC90
MLFPPFNSKNNSKLELRSKEGIDNILKPLTDNISSKVNGSLTCKDIYHTVVCMAVDNNLASSGVFEVDK